MAKIEMEKNLNELRQHLSIEQGKGYPMFISGILFGYA